MGYRLYFYAVPKKIISQIQKSESLIDCIKIAHPKRVIDLDYPCITAYEIEGIKKGYEFGSGGKEFKAITKGMRKLKWFHNDDHDCFVGGEKMLLRAIEFYQNLIIKNIKQDIEDAEIAKQTNESRLNWSKYMVNLDKNSTDIAGSWLYEHGIFNLVSFYKSVDLKKYNIIYTGW